jgi:hypothetical protein
MARQDPSADFAILVYLCFVTTLLCIFGYVFHWMMQPTVLTNSGASTFAGAPAPQVILRTSHSMVEDIELLAVETAELENREQGLKSPIAVVRAPTEIVSVPKTKVAAKKAAPRRVQQKRVVHVPPREPDPWTAWASNRNQRSSKNSSAFWSW